MIVWLQTHWGTIVVLLILLAVIAAAIGSVIHDRRSGASGCGCQGCAMRGKCHKNSLS
jgi:hypothetical protein